MRSLLQSGLGQFLFGSIVVAIILAFVLSGQAPSVDALSDDCAAEVGSHCVPPKDFYAAYGLVSAIGLNEQAAEQMRLREVIARGLAEREILVAEAKRLGISTSKEAVDTELLEGRTRVSLPAEGAERFAVSLALCVDTPSGCEPGTIGLRALPVKKNNVFDFELYKRMIRVATGRSPAQFKDMQVREHTAERMRQLIQSSVRVSEEEAFLTYERVRSQAVARFVTAKTSWFERYIVQPSEAQIQAWVSEHQEELKLAVESQKAQWKPGCAVVQELLLTSQEDESEDDVIARAKKLKQEIQLGGRDRVQSFDRVARKESQAASALLGGRVGCLETQTGPAQEELTAAAAELKSPGDLSEPVATVRGVYLLGLLDRVSEENVEELLQAQLSYQLTSAFLAQEAARQFVTTLIERLQKQEEIAEATEALLRETLLTSPLLAPGTRDVSSHFALRAEDVPHSDISRAFSMEQNPLTEATSDTSPAALVFALENPGDVVAQPVPLRQGFAVLQLKEKDLATRETFAQDRDAVLAQLRARKAEDILRQEIERLVQASGGIRFNERHVPPLSSTDSSSSPVTPG